MSRSEVRTRETWAGFDTMAWIIALILFLLWLFFWWTGRGKPDTGNCCGTVAAVVTPPAVAPPVVAPPVVTPVAVAPVATPPAVAATAPETAKLEPVPTPKSVDCAKIMEGVNVEFQVNKSILSEAGKRALDQTVVCLKEGKFEVAGHTDSDGSDASNQALSEARAASAVTYLKSKGIVADRLVTAGFGETKPIADNATAEGKAKNRRITFTPK